MNLRSRHVIRLRKQNAVMELNRTELRLLNVLDSSSSSLHGMLDVVRPAVPGTYISITVINTT